MRTDVNEVEDMKINNEVEKLMNNFKNDSIEEMYKHVYLYKSVMDDFIKNRGLIEEKLFKMEPGHIRLFLEKMILIHEQINDLNHNIREVVYNLNKDNLIKTGLFIY